MALNPFSSLTLAETGFVGVEICCLETPFLKPVWLRENGFLWVSNSYGVVVSKRYDFMDCSSLSSIPEFTKSLYSLTVLK